MPGLQPQQLEPLRQFLEHGTPVGQRHFYNAHFPGLYSIVLAADGDCLTRMFAAAPGELDADLESHDGTFLWHAHGYDFTETTLLGTVFNIVVTIGSEKIFHEYAIEAGIATARKPSLKRLRIRAFDFVREQICRPGESFSMTHEQVHRVVFQPDEKSGWFACLVQERNKRPAPSTVFCEKELDAVPHADVLYREAPDEDARIVVEEVVGKLATTW